MLDLLARGTVPPGPAAAARQALRHLDKRLHASVWSAARLGDEEAAAAAAAADHQPPDEAELPLFYFITRQWAHLDHIDPDGLRLHTYIFHSYPAARAPWLQQIAAAAGRRDPTLPVNPRHNDRPRTGTNYGGIYGGSY